MTTIVDYRCVSLVVRDDGGVSVELVSTWDKRSLRLNIPPGGNPLGLEEGKDFRVTVELLEEGK